VCVCVCGKTLRKTVEAVYAKLAVKIAEEQVESSSSDCSS